MYHGGTDNITYKGTEGELPGKHRVPIGRVDIPGYKGGELIGNFVHCVRTREEPFRNVEAAHRATTVCHLGNIAYWLGRPLKWDPAKEEIVGDPEANRWLSRPKRAPVDNLNRNNNCLGGTMYGGPSEASPTMNHLTVFWWSSLHSAHPT